MRFIVWRTGRQAGGTEVGGRRRGQEEAAADGPENSSLSPPWPRPPRLHLSSLYKHAFASSSASSCVCSEGAINDEGAVGWVLADLYI